MELDLPQELSQDLTEEELPVKIIPHRGKQPINFNPDIVADHLGVISTKTQPLKKRQLHCLARTGHSIKALRRASISGRAYPTETLVAGKRKKEKGVSLDNAGRLNVIEVSAKGSREKK